MKLFLSWSLVVSLVVSITSSLAAQQQENETRDLPNFYLVEAKVFRGGQPTKDGMKKLAALGIKTVINLRNDDGKAQAEEIEARAVGLRYFNVPLDTYGRPADEQVDRVLALITAAENKPVFVHCKRGSDRTGIVIAAYRISFNGWTGEQATAEAKHYGLGFWQRGMKDYIGDFYKRRKK
jgi:tyrosine-protein phosphatase SIW14